MEHTNSQKRQNLLASQLTQARVLWEVKINKELSRLIFGQWAFKNQRI